MEMSDAHSFTLASQGSIYTQTVIKLIDGSSKLIVATLNRKVFCFDLSMTHLARSCGCVVVPQTQELQFTYIPGGAEIISIDAYNRSTTSNDFVIGITIIKSVESGQYLNIYSDWEPSSHLELDSLGHSCLSLELDYIPYQLTNCKIQGETFWLLGASDNSIHIFREDDEAHMYTECEKGEFFVEFSDSFPSVPLFTSVFVSGGLRTAAVACECGHLALTQVNEDTGDLLHRWTRDFDGPLTSARLFQAVSRAAPLQVRFPTYMSHVEASLPPARRTNRDTKSVPVSLVVTYSLGKSMVYSDVISKGLADQQCLAGSDKFDVVTSLCTADLQFTGLKTLVLGTFGQELLGYSLDGSEWKLAWQRRFPAPILSIQYADMTGDGVKELIVITTRGVQVLQHHMDFVKKTALKKINFLVGFLTKN